MRREFGTGTWRERAKLYDDQCRRSGAAGIATTGATKETAKATTDSKLEKGEWGGGGGGDGSRGTGAR